MLGAGLRGLILRFRVRGERSLGCTRGSTSRNFVHSLKVRGKLTVDFKSCEPFEALLKSMAANKKKTVCPCGRPFLFDFKRLSACMYK
jgi:hypothetical protein